MPAKRSLQSQAITQLRGDLNFAQYDVERTNTDGTLKVQTKQTLSSFLDLGLPDGLYKAICKMGFQNPSTIQETVLPLLMEDPPTNIMAQSQSGTGKTAAFLLAALTRVKHEERWPQVLVILPTLELSEQIAKQCEHMLEFTTGVSVCHAVKGMLLERGKQISDQVVIGTPGKINDWALRNRNFDLKKIRVFVLDEADVMMAQNGHYVSCIKIHRELDQSLCQMLLFSATFDEAVKELAAAIIQEPFVKIYLRKEELNLQNIKHYYMFTRDPEEKRTAIVNLYQLHSIGQAIVFCKTRNAAISITKTMRELGQSVAGLHGELDPSQRKLAFQSFRDGEQKVLVTTNVCARGIDIPQVSLVINYDLPLQQNGLIDPETYYHRVGRTGRFGRPGTAIDFVNPDDTVETGALSDIAEEFNLNFSYIDFKSLESVKTIDNEENSITV